MARMTQQYTLWLAPLPNSHGPAGHVPGTREDNTTYPSGKGCMGGYECAQHGTCKTSFTTPRRQHGPNRREGTACDAMLLASLSGPDR